MATARSDTDKAPIVSFVEEDERQPSDSQLEDQVTQSKSHHIFSRRKKLQMVCIVSMAAIFSPLSSNIYFPALGEVSRVSATKTKHSLCDLSRDGILTKLYVEPEC